MKWFYNLGLAKKLSATLFIVMSFTIFIGGFSIVRMGKLDNALNEISSDLIPKTELLGRMASGIEKLQGMEIKHVISETAEQKTQLEKEMSEVLASIAGNDKQFLQLARRPEEKELFEKFHATWNGYPALHARIVAISRQGQEKEAATLIKGTAGSIISKATAEIEINRKSLSEKAVTARAEAKALYTSSRNLIIALVAVSLLLGLWLTHFIVRKVTLGSLWWALKTLERVSEGDLTQNIKVKSTEEIGQLFTGMKKIIEKLREFSSHINELTRSLATSSKELLGTTVTMNRSAHEQAGQTEQVASAVTEMSQTFIDVAANAEQASQASRETTEAAQHGFSTVEEVMGEMRKIVQSVQESSVTIGKLGQSSRKIGDIIATIEEVADQTNLLALNAAIEAARAGEHGRGFAVVADEVRALAERTGKATKEISAMIKAIQQDTALAVTSMMNSKKDVDSGITKAEEARLALEKIVEVSNRSMDMIHQIATATEEQSAVTEQVSSNVEMIAQETRSSESAAGQIQELAKLLAKLSEDLEETAHWFKVA